MSSVPKTYTRVGIFTATEVQIEAIPGEWIRDDDASTEPVTTKMNDFLAESGSNAVFVSPPTIELRAVSESGDRRTYFTSVSIIYTPAEAIYAGDDSDDFTNYSDVPSNDSLLAMGDGGALPPEIAAQIMANLAPANYDASAAAPSLNPLSDQYMTGRGSVGTLPADLTEKIVAKLSPDQVQEINIQNATQDRNQKQRQLQAARVMDGNVPLRGKPNVRTVPKLPRLG